MNKRIGFMQGRLSPIINGRIQSFPWTCWQDEFAVADNNNFALMEWTLDQENIYENPLLTEKGQSEIDALCKKHNLKIPSLTGDCFMQAPFWKATDELEKSLKSEFIAVVEACSKLGIEIVVIPLVDNGSLDSYLQEDRLIEYLESCSDLFSSMKIKIAFESDYDAKQLGSFIDRLDSTLFGVNYDIGNSAAMGFSAKEELDSYGHRVINVHIKDRPVGGATVPLGNGDADFDVVFEELSRHHYAGNYILQTARADDHKHVEKITQYRDMTLNWMRD